ncbi:MAG: hypothetical protein L6R38_000769 [Xanthoria sp. 2 TBL-2021]|nr:MAG: hypothetical protein L6R38_000769 [Xanthoria sp. 2 TBL-2021]
MASDEATLSISGGANFGTQAGQMITPDTQSDEQTKPSAHSTKTEAYDRVVMFTIKAEQQLITLRADGMDWKRVAEEFGVFSEHEDLERVMMAIEKDRGTAGRSGRQFLQLKVVQTQSINRIYFLVSTIQVPISKKADFALVYSRRDPAVRTVYDQSDRAGIALSQMTDTYTRRFVMAFGVEIKPAGGNSQETLAQLATWFAAGFAKLRELQELALLR